MKLWKDSERILIRLQIKQKGFEKSVHLAFEECTQTEVVKFVERAIKNAHKEGRLKINPLTPKVTYKTQVLVRRHQGAKQGKQNSVSFIGLNPEETKKMLLDYYHRNK